MAWAYFQNQAAFDTYHTAKCVDLGIPKAGYRQSDSAVQILNAWTDAAVNPIQVKGTGNVTAWVAHVDPADVAQYNLGLNIPDNQVTIDYITGAVQFTYQSRTYAGNLNDPVGFNHRKPKPPTWIDPVSGKTYNTTTGQEIP